jgi:hypothetical protein
MSSIQPMQLIFTRVEAAYSPMRKDGFQVVYQSAGLSAQVVSVLEEMVKGYDIFPVSAQTPVRWQYMCVEKETFVVTRSAMLPMHKLILDPDREVFLAHALVFTKAQFAAMKNQPFSVIDQFPVLQNAEALVAEYQQAEGREKQVLIEVEREADPLAATPGLEPLAVNLLGYAYQARSLSEQQRSLFIPGSPEEIMDVLRLGLTLAPPEYRVNCSFDTHIHGRKFPQGYFWAVGSYDTQDGRNYLPCNPRTPVTTSGRPQDFYVHWATTNLPANASKVLEWAEPMQAINSSFLDPARPLPDTIPDELLEYFLSEYKHALTERLAGLLGRKFSKSTTEELLSRYFSGNSARKLVAMAAAQAYDRHEYAGHLLNWLQEQAPKYPLAGKEWPAFTQTAQEFNDALLLFVVGLASNNNKVRVTGLEQMDAVQYAQALQFLQDPADFKKFLSVRLLDEFSLFMRNRYNRLESDLLADMLDEIIDLDGGKTGLDALIDQVPNLERKQFARVEKKVDKARQVSPAFVRAVGQRRRALGPDETLASKLTGWWNEDGSSKDKNKR